MRDPRGRWRVLVRRAVPVALPLALVACAGQGSGDGSDGAAVAACRGVLQELGASARLATTVREDGGGFLVSGWRDGRAEGSPDYLCQVARDESAARGVEVVRIQTSDGQGGYRSQLDLELDEDG